MKHVARLFVGIAIASALGLGAANPADAFSGSGSGRPGSLVPPAVQGSHHYVMGGWYPYLMVQNMTAWRSPATTGSQSVAAAFQVFRWNGSSWAYQTGSTVQGTIAAGYNSIRMPIWSITPTAGRGYYYVQMTVTWRSSTGVTLGTTNIYWNGSRDYECATVLTCSTGTGWVPRLAGFATSTGHPGGCAALHHARFAKSSARVTSALALLAVNAATVFAGGRVP